MGSSPFKASTALGDVVLATGEQPLFSPGDRVQVKTHAPIGHYRVPTYLRGKIGAVVAVIEPAAVNNEEEAFGRNAGSKRHYYRIAVSMREIWPAYAAASHDNLRIEIFETWLEGI